MKKINVKKIIKKKLGQRESQQHSLQYLHELLREKLGCYWKFPYFTIFIEKQPCWITGVVCTSLFKLGMPVLPPGTTKYIYYTQLYNLYHF